ncbi:MAG TPA: GGDEF domain-containing protein [Acidimicrobiales bacterium]|nr:GGDEF domain-containing protein [Acidimicrobiales bacterium]
MDADRDDSRSVFGHLKPVGDERSLGSSPSGWLSKRSVGAIAEAMKRSFASALASDFVDGIVGFHPGFVLALFQRRAYFELEEARYAAFVAAGATVVVGFPGEVDELPTGITGIDLTGREELVDSWVLIVIDGSLSAALVAVDDHGLIDGHESLEGSRSFVARWTFRREDAVEAFRQIMRPLSTTLPSRVLARAEGALRRAEETPISAGEDRLATAVEVLGAALVLGNGIPGSYATDWDLLTNVYNRRFLDRYVRTRAGESAALVAAILVDIDDLAKFNNVHGEVAGDQVLIAVADMLLKERRPGDLVIRYGDDEFLVLAPATDRESALARAERLVIATRALRLPQPCENESVSASASVVVSDPTNIPFDRLLDGMSLSKMLGKNLARLVDND